MRERVAAEPGIAMVVIDEVQKVPALLDVDHALVEEHPGLRFVYLDRLTLWLLNRIDKVTLFLPVGKFQIDRLATFSGIRP